jgi:prolyl oligopeptidase
MGEGSGSGPPVARVEMVWDIHFGATLEDPYRWMEREDQEFLRWLEGQAGYARSGLDGLPRRASLLARIRSLGGALPQISGLSLAGERVFYLWREADARVPVLMVRDPDDASGRQPGPSRILFDPRYCAG